MNARLSGVATPFGPLDLTVQADKMGRTVKLSLKPLAANCRAVIVHLPDGSTRQIPPLRGGTLRFAVAALPAAK
jgi:hypothetical protein